MNTFKRAVVNVIRQPIKSLSLLLLVMLLGGILLSGISMARAMVVTEEHLLMQVPAVATLIYDGRLSALWDQPTKEEIQSVGELPYVRAYDFTIRTLFSNRELAWANPMPSDLFPILGVNNPNIGDFESGTLSLLEGRTFTQEEIDNDTLVMVIPRNIAIVNDLTIGSRVGIPNIAHDFRYSDWSDHFNENFILDKRVLEFEVIGIFGADFPYEDDVLIPFAEPTIFYMPIGVAQGMMDFVSEAMLEADEAFFRGIGQGILQEEAFLETLFILNSPRDLEAFTVAAEVLIHEDWQVVGIDESVFAPVITSMDMVLELAETIQFVVIIASILIITLVLLLFLRDRRHEIGVYMALGDKKEKVIFQVLMEVGIVSIVGLFLAILIGNGLASLLSSYLFEQHLIEQLAAPVFGLGNLPIQLNIHIPWEMTVDEALILLDVSLDLETILRFVLAGIIVILTSTIVPIWYATKLKPKELLLQGKIG